MPHKQQPASVGAYHYAANKEIFEPQRGNNFDFIIDKSLNGIGAYGSDSKKFPNAQEYIRLSVKSTSVPHFSQNVIEVKRGNTTTKYAGTISFDGGRLECYDFIGAETKDILMAWQAKSGNPLFQTVGVQADYKVDCRLLEYSPDYDQLVRTWVLNGCWISGMREDDFNVDSNGTRAITLDIQYDRAYPDYSAE